MCSSELEQTPANQQVRGPRDATIEPRFANMTTFARLPRLDQVDQAKVVIIGAPFDSGVSYRPGARFGPLAIRNGSQLLRPFDPALGRAPFSSVQVADGGDIAINPFSIEEAIATIEGSATQLYEQGAEKLLTLGGDHTIALPLLRAAHKHYGGLALIHFDAHLDTWNTYFGAAYTHGTPFRRASEENLITPGSCLHVGCRGPLYSADDLAEDSNLGFTVITSDDLELNPEVELSNRIRSTVGELPVYLSIDIDVLDPSAAPGTGTPEAGGPSSGKVLRLLRSLSGLPVIGADIVEVAPAYDHAEITSIAAAHIAYTLVGLMVSPWERPAR
jgi:agmatinase